MGSRESRYRPLTPEEIAATGLDYLAWAMSTPPPP